MHMALVTTAARCGAPATARPNLIRRLISSRSFDLFASSPRPVVVPAASSPPPPLRLSHHLERQRRLREPRLGLDRPLLVHEVEVGLVVHDDALAAFVQRRLRVEHLARARVGAHVPGRRRGIPARGRRRRPTRISPSSRAAACAPSASRMYRPKPISGATSSPSVPRASVTRRSTAARAGEVLRGGTRGRVRLEGPRTCRTSRVDPPGGAMARRSVDSISPTRVGLVLTRPRRLAQGVARGAVQSVLTHHRVTNERISLAPPRAR